VCVCVCVCLYMCVFYAFSTSPSGLLSPTTGRGQADTTQNTRANTHISTHAHTHTHMQMAHVAASHRERVERAIVSLGGGGSICLSHPLQIGNANVDGIESGF